MALVLSVEPRYRTLVRGLIPIDVQDTYWEHCYRLVDAVEVYLDPSPSPVGFAIEPETLEEVLANPAIVPGLREWTSIARVVGETLTEPQQTLGDDILKRIDQEAVAQP